MSNYLSKSVKELNELLKNKTIKPSDLTKEAFAEIEKLKGLNAFINLNKEEAMSFALQLDEKPVDNLFFGIPVVISDNIMTKGFKTTGASKMLHEFDPVYNATVVDIIKNKNMVIVGKANLAELGIGNNTFTSYYGPVKNPMNMEYSTGGGAAGSAVALRANFSVLAIAGDLNGSIRQSATSSGVVGMKPTYGRVSRYGLLSVAASLEQIGPLSHNVYDNAILLNLISKQDKNDLTSTKTDEDFTRLINKDLSNVKIAVPNYYISDVINSEILTTFKKTIKVIEQSGAQIEYVGIPYLQHANNIADVILSAEASSNLSIYDGVRFGYSAKLNNIEQNYLETRTQGFNDLTKSKIILGTHILSGANLNKYYYHTLKLRSDMTNNLNKVFEHYDLIISPTTAQFEPLAKLLRTSSRDNTLTVAANLTGMPSLSMPIGVNKNNLPIGLQITANNFNEAVIYQLASYVEKELNLNLQKEEIL